MLESVFAKLPTEERKSLGAMGWLRIMKALLDIWSSTHDRECHGKSAHRRAEKASG